MDYQRDAAITGESDASILGIRQSKVSRHRSTFVCKQLNGAPIHENTSLTVPFTGERQGWYLCRGMPACLTGTSPCVQRGVHANVPGFLWIKFDGRVDEFGLNSTKLSDQLLDRAIVNSCFLV